MSYQAVMAEHKAAILAILAATPDDMSGKDILRRMPPNVSITRMQYLLRLLVADQAVHVSRTVSSSRFYRTGPDTGQVPPTPAERILFVLRELGPQTAQQLQESTGMSRAYINEIINRELRPADGPRQLYIRQYLKFGNIRQLLYDIGNRPDAVRPKPLTVAQKQRAKRLRMKAHDPDRLAEQRIRDRLRKIKPHADPVLSQFSGLFGSRIAA